MNDADDIVKEFLIESLENLERLDRELVALEEEPHHKEYLASIFRTIHTIKGSCGFLGFPKLEKVTHAGENLLSRLRDGTLESSTDIISVLLAMVDAVRQILAFIEDSGTEGTTGYEDLISRINLLMAGGSLPSEKTAPDPEVSRLEALLAEHAAPAPAPAKPALPVPGVVRAAPAPAPAPAPMPAAAPAPTPAPKPVATAVPTEILRFGDMAIQLRYATQSTIEKAMQQQISTQDPRHIGEILVERGDLTPQQVKEILANQGEVRRQAPVDNSIRVDVALLDRLMNLVGELVLARNQILQFTRSQDDSTFVAATQRLNLITTELQEGVMKTRMQPIGTVWNKFPRVVRDLGISCGKQVRLEMEGRETELDKTLIEAIKDPLTHLIRNAVDHGIETPDVRIAQGKPAEGCLSMRAFHEGGQVNIELIDDGAGVNLERVKQTALKKGLIGPDQASRLSEHEAVNLLFLPGFSTAETVTNISGRGVGMDVVKTNIEKIGGTIDLQSRWRNGTTLRIKIPLTLAIIPALIITSGGERFAIPQINLLELVRLEGERVRTGIETILGAPVYRLRGSLLPLMYLNQELGLPEVGVGPNGTRDDGLNIVVLQADERQFGMVVDSINDTEEIVVKPLGKQLKGINVFAGATIMGEGRVALILDVLGIAQRSRVVSQLRERKLGGSAQQSTTKIDDRVPLLMFEVENHGRMVVPLGLVDRLEEFSPSAIEWAGSQEVVQYRGSIMPLLRVSNALPERRAAPRTGPSASMQRGDKQQVVVYSDSGGSVGPIVDVILDVVEESLSTQRPATRAGILGTVVIQTKVTQILDIKGIVAGISTSDSPMNQQKGRD